MEEVEVGAIGGKGEEGAAAGGSSCGGSAEEVLVGILSKRGEGEGAVLVGEVGLERSEGVEDMKAGAVWGEGEEKAGVLGAMEGGGGIEASVGSVEEGIRVERLVEGDVVEEGMVEGEVRLGGLFGGGYHGNAGEDGEGNGSQGSSQLGRLGQLAAHCEKRRIICDVEASSRNVKKRGDIIGIVYKTRQPACRVERINPHVADLPSLVS